MVSVRIYVEGGGDSKELHIRCRRGVSKLLENAGYQGRMPQIIACGGRNQTFDKFAQGVRMRANAAYDILLVDSEDPVEGGDEAPDSPVPWQHLMDRDEWTRPADTANDQAQLMITCMETWIVADPGSLSDIFGPGFRTTALPSLTDLETRSREDVQARLETATQGCGRRGYTKGKRSFQVLEQLDARRLRERLPHFRRLLATLDRHLTRR